MDTSEGSTSFYGRQYWILKRSSRTRKSNEKQQIVIQIRVTQDLVKGEGLKEVKVMHRSRMKRRSRVMLLVVHATVILRDVPEEATKVDILRGFEDDNGNVINSSAQKEIQIPNSSVNDLFSMMHDG
eukprot:scaffold4796_cov136-Chaetoceros_neogracile.AAC.1